MVRVWSDATGELPGVYGECLAYDIVRGVGPQWLRDRLDERHDADVSFRDMDGRG